jgi:putative hemolysin
MESLLSFPLVVIVVIIAWLTGGAMAVRSASRIWLRHWAEQSLGGAHVVESYLDRPQRLLGAASAGVATTALIAGLLLGGGHPDTGGHLVFALWLLVFATVLLIFGQIVPRVVARRWPSSVVPVTIPVLRVAQFVTAPILKISRIVSNRLTPPSTSRRASARDTLNELLRDGELEGVGERDEIAIISGVVAFGDKVVREVMTDRDEIFALDLNLGANDIAVRIAQSGYSRVPLYEGTLDDINVMVHVLDVLESGGDALPELRPVADVKPDARCVELLFRMLQGRLHLAIVRGPAGQTIGLVTLEDLLEELVGDIRDEHDEPEPDGSAPGRAVEPGAS